MTAKVSLYLFIFILLITGCTTCGCICGGLSSPGQPVTSENKSPDNHVTTLENPGASVRVQEASSSATPAPAPAATARASAFTIYAEGGKDHRPGDIVRFYGVDTNSDVVYLFVSCTMAPACGGQLKNAGIPVIDGDPTTFTRVNVSEDGSWEYFWTVPEGRPSLLFDLYNVIATSEPRDKPHLDEAVAWDMVTVKIS